MPDGTIPTMTREYCRRPLTQAHNAGHGRVFVPAGTYYITNTLTLYENTVLMGVGAGVTRDYGQQVVEADQREVTMLQTVDDANATTTLAWLTLSTWRICLTDTNYSWFNIVHWRAGRNSMLLGVDAGRCL